MADVITTIRDQAVTLKDNGDGTFRIDLDTKASRAFIREGELADLRAERDATIERRNGMNQDISDANALIDEIKANRDAVALQRDALSARVDALRDRITELSDWVTSVGD